MPIGILAVVLFYQLVLVSYVHEWGESIHFGFEILLYGIAGPVVTFIVLSWIDRQLRLRELAEEEARIEKEKREAAVLDERARIAREIHEGVSQNLYFLGLQLEVIQKKIYSDPVKAEEKLCSLQELLQLSISDLRRLISALRPVELEKLGPFEAIRRLATDLEKQTGLKIELDLEDSDERFSPRLEGAIYRIVQEALNNVAKHASSERAIVRVGLQRQEVVLQVEDEGTGFDPGELSERMDQGLGLRHLEERAQELGGWFKIDSVPTLGTKISAGLPLTVVNDD